MRVQCGGSGRASIEIDWGQFTYLLRLRINAAVLSVMLLLLNEHCPRSLSHHVEVPIAANAAARRGGARGSGVVHLREDRVRMEERRSNKMGRANECSM